MVWAVQGFVLNHLLWFVSLPAIAIFVALIIFVPGAGLAILAFLRTTFGKVMAAFLIGCCLSGIGGWEFRAYLDTREAERAKIEAQEASLAIAKQQMAAVEKQARENEIIQANAAQRVEDAEKRSRNLEGKVDEYIKKLAHRKGGACLLTPYDARSLRGIFGGRASADPANAAR